MNTPKQRGRVGLLAFVLVLAALLTLSACGGQDDDNPQLEGFTRPTATPMPTGEPGAPAPGGPLAGLPVPPVDQMKLPELEDVAGRVLFARDEKLFLVQFDGDPAMLVADDVILNYALPAPDGSRAIYNTMNLHQTESSGVNRSPAPAVVDLSSLAVQMFPAPNGYSGPALLAGWLPDGNALGWDRARGFNVINPATGEQVYVGGQSRFAWTDESKLVLVDDAEMDARVVEDASLYLVDPFGESRVALDIPIEYPVQDFLALEGALAEQGVHFADNYHDYHSTGLRPDGTRVYIERPVNAGWRAMPYCQPWGVATRATPDTPPEIVYTDDNTTYLTDLTVLPDGSVLFLRWTLEGCEFLGEMQVELLHLAPGEAPVVLTDAINPGLNGNANDFTRLMFESRRKYDVSPDGRYVLWIGGGLSSGTSSLYAIDLETGTQAQLMTLAVAPSGTNHIETVFWLPQ